MSNDSTEFRGGGGGFAGFAGLLRKRRTSGSLSIIVGRLLIPTTLWERAIHAPREVIGAR
jgi:hypothetical protein